jgi:hypothetical protein
VFRVCTLDIDRPGNYGTNANTDGPLPAVKSATISWGKGGAVSEFQYPSWQKPLQDAIDEPDLKKLPEKLSAAESAIFLRMQELAASSDGDSESEAIRLACRELLKIQTQRLKWPVSEGMLSDCAE